MVIRQYVDWPSFWFDWLCGLVLRLLVIFQEIVVGFDCWCPISPGGINFRSVRLLLQGVGLYILIWYGILTLSSLIDFWGWLHRRHFGGGPVFRGLVQVLVQ